MTKKTAEKYEGQSLWRSFFVNISWIIMLFVLGIFLGLALRNEQLLEAEITARAKAYFETMVLTRRWVARHGGVYVKKTEGIESNPYLENPEIQTIDGQIYTKKNPAIITREISELTSESKVFNFRISSLKPLNPNNKPDSFERDSLISFEGGETHAITKEKRDQKLIFRYMEPLFVEESCLKCHAKQGYKLNDIRGGISVSFDISEEQKEIDFNFYVIVALGILTLAFLLGIINYFIIALNFQITRLNNLKDQFMAATSHDLRAPLSGIIGFSSLLLQEDTIRGEQKEWIKYIEESGNLLNSLIGDILILSKIQYEKELPYEEFCLDELLETVLATLRHMARPKEISLDFQSEGKVYLRANKNAILRILNNIITNAIKFTPQQGRVKVTLSLRGNKKVQISIEDTGIGIPAEFIPKLFDKFSGVARRGTLGETSTGLGLSIVKGLIERHSGTITVDSEEGKGTCFTIQIPLHLD